MARRIYRVCRARYARLDGEGAKRVGGRWNSPGRAVYMAERIALAVLENLVHLSRQDFPTGYVCVAPDLPDGLPILSERDLRRQYELGELNFESFGRLVDRLPSVGGPDGPVHDGWRRMQLPPQSRPSGLLENRN